MKPFSFIFCELVKPDPKRLTKRLIVDFAMETKNLKFYAVPTCRIDEWLKKDFKEWVSTPGKNNRPHDPANKKRHLSQEKFTRELSKYLNKWEKLWE